MSKPNNSSHLSLPLRRVRRHESGKSKKDGRVLVSSKNAANTGYLAKALGPSQQNVPPSHAGLANTYSLATANSTVRNPRLNIVIMVVGSRGDIQPFLQIGKILKERRGHRVRVATHPEFRSLVESNAGLEFFSVGGNPSELMAFMVKNPGMLPSIETIKAGEIGRRRQAMAEVFNGFWRACIDSTDGETTMPEISISANRQPFVADAIIANPPSFAHVHCAEALGIPLQLVFTFPYTPTHVFPHPLASVGTSSVDPGYSNFISYPLVELMIWQGLGDLINDLRVKSMALEPVSKIWAPGACYRMRVPVTYLWSPALIPKPHDWGEEIDITGFVFLDMSTAYSPPPDLVEFLEGGEAPIYIGFGSIVVDDPSTLTDTIFSAIKKAGVRAVVSRGWGDFGRGNIPDNVFMVDNVPHDWLFPRVKACVIHGGAGTTAISMKTGLPTMIVPFFGDQYFWGSMVGISKAGPTSVPYKALNSDKLAEGINYLVSDEAKEAAATIARYIELDGDGAENAVRSLETHLACYGPSNMCCSLLDNAVAVWEVKGAPIRLSAAAADILVHCGEITWKRLRLLRHIEWNDFEGPGEPITGIASEVDGVVHETQLDKPMPSDEPRWKGVPQKTT